jgi:hypothetical protein
MGSLTPISSSLLHAFMHAHACILIFGATSPEAR